MKISKKDLMGTYPKWMMFVWCIICLIGAVFVWKYSAIVSVLLLIVSWTFLSYLWGAKIWGKQK